MLPLRALPQPTKRRSVAGNAALATMVSAKCATGPSTRLGLGVCAGGRIAGSRGGALRMVFLPDDYKGASDDDDSEAAGSGSSESSESEWDDRNAIIRAYSPITGTSLETPEELNEKLRPTGLDRHRLTVAPDEAFGCIFRLEGALLDTTELHRSAWTQVPGLRLPHPIFPRFFPRIFPRAPPPSSRGAGATVGRQNIAPSARELR